MGGLERIIMEWDTTEMSAEIKWSIEWRSENKRSVRS